MLRKTAALLIASGIVAGASMASAQSWERVSTKDAFLAVVDGKTMTRGESTAKIRPNGTGSGTTGRGDYVLNWVWDSGRYCRNFQFADRDTPSGTICARIHVAGEQIHFTNLSGDRSQSIWDIK